MVTLASTLTQSTQSSLDIFASTPAAFLAKDIWWLKISLQCMFAWAYQRIDDGADSEVVLIFKLADLIRIHSTKLGTSLHGCVNSWSTKLKDRYLHILQAHKKGQDIPFVFNNDVQPAMRKACKYDANTDVIQLADFGHGIVGHIVWHVHLDQMLKQDAASAEKALLHLSRSLA